EHTRFIRDFLQAHPEELEVRREGRALWWDRPEDAETRRRHRESGVPQKPYYYQSE
ncbi:MAG: DUF3460 domain-containing protein, partial [Rhodocyclales bacterium CG17_big_fil_post_rev_8_21_14_2_50_68_7]